MATITSVKSGLWSDPTVWNAGVPVNNDIVVIALNHTVTLDVDQSGFADGIAGLTITGALICTDAPGTYQLKIQTGTTISGAGTFTWGSTVFAAKHTLTGGANWYVQGSGGLTMNVIGAEPAIKYALLTGAESAGATRLEIDTDLTGDIWAVGDTIRINNVNKAVNSEERVIAAIASTYIDITVGLTSAKIAGTVIALMTRNTKIISVGTSQATVQNFASGKFTMSGGQQTGSNYMYLRSCTGAAINGGSISKNNDGLNNCTLAVINGCSVCGNYYASYNNNFITVNGGVLCGNFYMNYIGIVPTITAGLFEGCDAVIYGGATCLISGGTFIGNGNALQAANCAIITGGIFSGNSNAIYTSNGVVITDAVFSANTYDVQQSKFSAHDTQFGLTTENYLYTNLSEPTYSESINHNAITGALRAWTKGGVTTTVATPLPVGFTRAYQMVLASATVRAHWRKQVLVPAGKTISITTHLRKDASMTYLPRTWVYLDGDEPFTTPADILHEFIMTNSTDTWESDTWSYTNTANYDVMLAVRFVGMNATGNVFCQSSETFGGGISRSRITGGM